MKQEQRPGVMRLAAQEGARRAGSPIRDIQEQLDAVLAGAVDPDDGSLTLPGVVTATGLELPHGLTFEQWQRVGFTLKRISASWRFWYGDWLRYGEHAYGEMYSQAMDDTGMEYRQLAQIVHVAKKIDPSMRRSSLSWSTHASVARLSHEAAVAVLDKAEAEGLTRQEVRAAVKAIVAASDIPPAETLLSTCLCHCHSGKCPDCGKPS